MKTLGHVFVLLTAAGFWAFLLTYHLRSRGQWRRSEMGVHLMSFMGGLALVMVIVLVRRFGSEVPEWLFTLMWLVVGALVWWRVALLFAAPPHELVPPARHDEEVGR